MNDRSMAVLFSYARQGMEGDHAGLKRAPAANRRETATLTVSPGPAPPCKAITQPAATQLPHVPHGGAQWAPRACARERRPAFGSRRRTAR